MRESNQDILLINGMIYARMNTPHALSCRGGVFAIADGVGGEKGGDKAAALLLGSLGTLEPDAACDLGAVTARCEEASDAMRELALHDNTMAHMAVTFAGIALSRNQAAVFNCGDCRVYRYSAPYLAKLTHDHSVVQALFDEGVIDEDAMRLHPQKNMITSAVSGEQKTLGLFHRVLSLDSPQTFFLCSDGVWEALPLDVLERILRSPAEQAAGELVAALFAVTASDNISFIILEKCGMALEGA